MSTLSDPRGGEVATSIFQRLRAHLPAEVDFKIHRARNTAITNRLRAGTYLHATMRLAGHKSPKVTERYAGGFSDEELRRMARPAFSMIDGNKAVWSPECNHPGSLA